MTDIATKAPEEVRAETTAKAAQAPQAPAAAPAPAAPAAREEAASPFDALRREIDRLFDDFRPAGWRMALRRPSAFELGWPRLEGWQLNPAVDMVEKDAAFEITAELPGIDEKNVEIRLANGNLTIRGEKQEVKEEREKEYHLSERRYGAFQRMFRVPEGVDFDRIEAKVEKGVLTVTLPKAPGAKSSERQISIKSA